MSSNGVELFSGSYLQARERFLAAAQTRGLAVETHALDLPGAQGEALATDVVLDGPADAERLLLVLSGVHGAEGYSGSALQTGFLLSGGEEWSRPADVAVLHVHAVNPHGFSHGRRVTQENVDLNRNFVDFDRPLPPNPAYGDIHDHLLPSSWPPPAEAELALAAYAERHGLRGLQRAAKLGQHTHPDGICFGGTEPTWSNRTFRSILRHHASKARWLGSIDIHTGLGPHGHGERIFGSLQDAMLEPARRWWGKLTSVQTGTSTSVPMKGPIQIAIHEECPQAWHVGICLEFGTLPFDEVTHALRSDHWLYRHGADTVPPALAGSIRAAVRRAYYPETPDWKSAVWTQGRQAYLQALDGLAALPPVQPINPSTLPPPRPL